MERPDYRRLLQSGEIKNFTDLMNAFRQEIIQVYKSRSHWPKYIPNSEEADWSNIFSALNLDDIMDFSTFILIVKELKGDKN